MIFIIGKGQRLYGDYLVGNYLVAGNYLALIWFQKLFSWGLFGFAFIAPRIGTLQLLQLYETDANDVTMAMIIFTRIPDVSLEAEIECDLLLLRLYLASYEYRSHHNIVDRNFASLTFRFEANVGSSCSGRVERRRSKNLL